MAAAKTRKRRKVAKVTLATLPPEWDTGPRHQWQRPHEITERGDTDPETGQVRNPNNVRGVKYLSEIDRLAKLGVLTRDQVAAATNWAELCHRMFGSPAQRSCLDTDPIGHDKPGPSPWIVSEYRELCRALGVFERRLLDDVAYRNETCPPTRHDLLARGLQRVADRYTRLDRRRNAR